MLALQTKQFVYKYLTNALNLILYIGVIGFLFSFAFVFRANLMKNYNILTNKLNRNERNLRNYDFLLNETILSNYEKVVENVYIDLAKCSYRSKYYEPFINTEHCQTLSNTPHLCPSEQWINYKNYCLKPIEEKLSWYEAYSKCHALNSSLISIKDVNKQSFISKIGLSVNFTREPYFIALKRQPATKDNWYWPDGEFLTFNNWNFGEPNNQDLEENCAELIISSDKNKNGKWNDISCTTIRRDFICEKKFNFNFNDLVFELFKNKNITEENLFEVMYELFKLTEQGVFTASHISNIAIIFEKVSALSIINYQSGLLLFRILNNILNSPESEFQTDIKVSNSILKSIEKSIKLIVINETGTYEEIRLNLNNLIVRINDMALIDEEASNEFNYLPMTQEFIRKFHSFENNLAFVLVKSKLHLIDELGQNLTNSAFFPNGLNTLLASTRFRVSILYFKTTKLFQSSRVHALKNNLHVAKPILSVNINPLSNSSLINNKNIVEYEISLRSDHFIQTKSLQCAHWKFDKTDGYWSNDGCKYIHYEANTEYHKCACNHTTHFSLLFNPSPYAFRSYSAKAPILRSITYVGLCLSSIALLVTLITYTMFRSMRHGLVHQSLIMLASTLLFTNVIFTFTSFITPSLDINSCIIFGVLLHYLLLSSFMLMVVISVAQYLSFVKIFDYYIKHFIIKSVLFSFGLPILIPLTILVIDPKIYINTNQSVCWLSGLTLYVSFIGPVAAVSLVNLAFFGLILYNVLKKKPSLANSGKNQTSVRFRQQQIVFSLACFLLTGSTWLIGLTLLVEYEFRIVPEIIFFLLNTLHGFFIFLFHVFLSKSKKKLWQEFLRKKSIKIRNELRSMSNMFKRDHRSAFRPVKKVAANLNMNATENNASDIIVPCTTNDLVNTFEADMTLATQILATQTTKVFTIASKANEPALNETGAVDLAVAYNLNSSQKKVYYPVKLDEIKFKPISRSSKDMIETSAPSTSSSSPQVHHQHQQVTNLFRKQQQQQQQVASTNVMMDETSSDSKNYFSDDISMRINRLNDSLRRIKNCSEEKTTLDLSSDDHQSPTAATFQISELPTLFFD